MRPLLKFILVLGLFAAGILFLLKGLGVTTPLVTYKGAEAHGVPVGIVLLIMGVLLARFWKTSSSRFTRSIVLQDGTVFSKRDVRKIVGTLGKIVVRQSASLEGDSHTRPPRD